MRSILLVDLHAVFCRYWFASADQEIGAAYEGTISRVRGAAEGYGHVVVCYDWPPYNRKTISADYKANRDKPDPTMLAQIVRVKERLTLDGYLLLGAQGYEADDIIATCVRRLCEITQHSIDILTQDKDLLSLVTDRVNVVLLSDSTRMTTQKVREKMGVDPCHVSELLALCGDKADNVTGCPGCGPKRAAELLTAHESLDRVIALAVSGDTKNLLRPPALRQSLLDHHQDVALAWDLVALQSDAPIDVDKIFEKREVMPLKSNVQDGHFETDDDHGDAWEGDEFPIPGAVNVSETPKKEVVPSKTIDEQIQQQAQPTIPNNERPEVPRLPAADTTPSPPPAPDTPKPPTAIVPAAPLAVYTGSFEMQLEPRSLRECSTLADHIFQSRKLGFGRAEEVEAIVLAGRELGLPAMVSIRSLFISRDKVCMSGACTAALVIRSGLAEYFELEESDEKHATYATKRKGGRKDHVRSYSVAEAQKIGLVRPQSGWVNYPQNMCEWRAAAFLARSIYPDVTLGLYTKEEMDDML
jgi:5'-3' exonuclease